MNELINGLVTLGMLWAFCSVPVSDRGTNLGTEGGWWDRVRRCLQRGAAEAGFGCLGAQPSIHPLPTETRSQAGNGNRLFYSQESLELVWGGEQTVGNVRAGVWWHPLIKK